MTVTSRIRRFFRNIAEGLAFTDTVFLYRYAR
jgi:hypothetical protein